MTVRVIARAPRMLIRGQAWGHMHGAGGRGGGGGEREHEHASVEPAFTYISMSMREH